MAEGLSPKALRALQVADANNPAQKTEDREAISFDGPMDSVYLAAPEHVQLDVGTGARSSRHPWC